MSQSASGRTQESVTSEPASNACLAALSLAALSRLKPHLHEVTLAANTRLWEPGRPVSHSFFPVSGFISIVMPLINRQTIEVAGVGREGAVGSDRDEGRFATIGLVTIGGRFIKIAADVLRDAAAEDDEIGLLLRLCHDWIFIQAQQIAACNTAHAADQRFCRWLFECSRRLQSSMIYATQEQIAGLLGIRRTTVTLLAQGLHTRGLIDYSRGKIAIANIEALHACTCGCCDSLTPQYWPSKRLASPTPNAHAALDGRQSN